MKAPLLNTKAQQGAETTAVSNKTSARSLPAVPVLQRKAMKVSNADALTADTQPVQAKIVLQREAMPEEEPVQGKFTAQKQAVPEEETIQGKFAPIQRKEKDAASENTPIQKKANDTGLPDNLKAGVEQMSGYSMNDVKVHYNSARPAQLHAHAYAQGTDIHLAQGQEKHLPHEAWHVVQQKQGRVKPTLQMKGTAINDDGGLEHEADVMGANALQMRANGSKALNMAPTAATDTIQRMVWTWTNGSWVAASETKSPAPGFKGKKQGQKHDDGVAVAGVGPASATLTQAKKDATAVTKTVSGVEVYLDIDQLKHQPAKHPIGTRKKGGGTKFDPREKTEGSEHEQGSPEWHKEITMEYIGKWAAGLNDLVEDVKEYHGQGEAHDKIHYEGYCLLSGGKKYVFFHCYPER